jgi:ParB family chromosome partitioning protein
VSALPDSDHAAEVPEPDGSAGCRSLPACMVSVDLLTGHLGNVREDLDLSTEFLASVAEVGVRVPLLVTRHDGGYLVIDGHRRLAAAVKAGLAEVPCVLDPNRVHDEAGQFLDMVIVNSDGHRRNFTPAEEAAALFAAHEAGATRTRLRKATGRKADQIKAALAAGGISEETRTAAGELVSQLTLDQLALLAEFDGDEGAVARMVTALSNGGYSAEYMAERIRLDRAEAAQHEQLVADLRAAGTAITEDLPPGAVHVTGLLHEGEELTPEAHASCPGRGVFFPPWSLAQPVHYCASPEVNGHEVHNSGLPASGGNGVGVAAPDVLPEPPAGGPHLDHDPGRKLVIEGNKAWKAAGEVRKRWLANQLFARRAAPREAARFVARQLLTMPVPLRCALTSAPGRLLFSDLTRQPAESWLEICDTTAASRLPLLMLGPIVTAYEQAMTEAEGRNTWRTDRYSPCPRGDASRYLTFLASIGYQLSGIEQAVADEVAWTGDALADQPTADPADSISGESDGCPGESGDSEDAVADEPAELDGSQDDALPEAA